MIERDWSQPLNLEMEGLQRPDYQPLDAKGMATVFKKVDIHEAEHGLIPERLITHHFMGAGVETTQDELRLGTQYDRILEVMADNRWRTLSEIQELTHYPEGSIIRQLNYMADVRCGGHKKEKHRRGPGRGLWEYRIILKGQKPPEQTRDQWAKWLREEAKRNPA